jgi:hypothetical protein
VDRVRADLDRCQTRRIDVAALPPAAPGQLRWFATAKMLAKIAT